MKFSFETEKCKISREKVKFTTIVFRKDVFSGVYTNFRGLVAL